MPEAAVEPEKMLKELEALVAVVAVAITQEQPRLQDQHTLVVVAVVAVTTQVTQHQANPVVLVL